MKAIVLIDEFPKSCYECPLTHSEAGFFGDICDSVCTVLDRTNIVFMDGMGKPEWCPLKPLPRKLKIDKTLNFYGYENFIQGTLAMGFNACLDEIIGGSENAKNITVENKKD